VGKPHCSVPAICGAMDLPAMRPQRPLHHPRIRQPPTLRRGPAGSAGFLPYLQGGPGRNPQSCLGRTSTLSFARPASLFIASSVFPFFFTIFLFFFLEREKRSIDPYSHVRMHVPTLASSDPVIRRPSSHTVKIPPKLRVGSDVNVFDS